MSTQYSVMKNSRYYFFTVVFEFIEFASYVRSVSSLIARGQHNTALRVYTRFNACRAKILY